MRPIEMTMQAFGPYAEVTVIPFEKITSGGLYLICGNTGSGKTMLFDAVTYALYGDASGQNRDPAMLRSKYASPDDKTYVKLTFENGGKIYTVYREWGREKMKKGVLTEEKSNEAWLLCPDGRTVSKHKDVTAAVTDIIGLDRERFAKTVMIAQGEFRELLYADTKDRMVILRRIFGTEIFENFSRLAKDAAKKALSDAEMMRSEAKRYAALIVTDNENYQSLLASVPAVSVSDLDRAAEANRLAAVQQIEEVNKKYLSAEQQSRETKRSLSRAEIDREREKEAELCRMAYTKAQKRHVVAAAGAEETKNLPAEAAALTEQVSVYKAELPAYDELDAVSISLKKDEEALSAAEGMIEKSQKRIEAAEAETESLSRFIESGAGYIEKSRALEVILMAEKNESTALERIIAQLAELDRMKADEEKRKSAYEKALTQLNIVRQKHTEAMHSYFDGIAGVLSASLADGKPCPVCGSTSHPSPAQQDSSTVTREDLDKLSLESEAIARKTEECASALAKIRGTADQLSLVIESACRNLGYESADRTVVFSRSAEVKHCITEKTALLDEYNCIIEKTEAAREKLARYQKLLESERTSLADHTATYAEKKAVIGEKQARLSALHEKLTYRSSDELKKEIARLSALSADMLDRAERAEKLVIQTEKELEAAGRALETVTAQLSGSIAGEYDRLCRESSELDRLVSDITEEKIRLTNLSERSRSTEALLRDAMERLVSAEEYAVMCSSVSDTANGSVSGKDKIMLETFWQMRLFERILRRANIRLMQMTDGRYELIRRTTASNQKSQSGLDLDIIDHWNGSVRNVKSLSGGEAFTASLALAFALSDETEAEAGGVKIDAMFIDEGFGSLDEEALSQAMAVLEAQSSAGRSVGIISHVETLRERIPRKIVVKKQNGTSRVELEGV